MEQSQTKKDAFGAVFGYDVIKQQLREIADYFKHPQHYAKFSARMISGLLLDGEPGLGKTLMANCLIEESGLPAFVFRKDTNAKDILKAIKKTFAQAAECAPAVIFFDDIDKLSNNDYQLPDTEEFVTIQSCIDEYKDTNVFVVATCNNLSKLPHSLKREGRFDRVLSLSVPRGQDAYNIVQSYLAMKNCRLNFDIAEVVSIVEGHSCAFLETVINEASLIAGYMRAGAISLEHFIHAYARMMNKDCLATFDASKFPQHIAQAKATERASVSYHEAGHVLVGEVLLPGSTTIAFLSGADDNISGLTAQSSVAAPSAYERTKYSLLVGLGSVCAIENKYGIPEIGASQDLEDSAAMVVKLLKRAGLGGMRHTTGKKYSSSEQLDYENEFAAAVLLEQYRWDVRQIIANHIRELDAIAEVLYQKGYILAKDIAKIMHSGETAIGVMELQRKSA